MSIEDKIQKFKNDLNNLNDNDELQKFRYLLEALDEVAKEIRSLKAQKNR